MLLLPRPRISCPDGTDATYRGCVSSSLNLSYPGWTLQYGKTRPEVFGGSYLQEALMELGCVALSVTGSCKGDRRVSRLRVG